jgi:TRAP-type C4-dicarboxylate transport system permease large subunit
MDVIRSAVPFVFLGIVAIALVMAFPAIALWLPELMR